jgi:hypothetical protein
MLSTEPDTAGVKTPSTTVAATPFKEREAICVSTSVLAAEADGAEDCDAV